MFLNVLNFFLKIVEIMFIKFLKICVLPSVEKKNIWLRITFSIYSTFFIKTGFDLTVLIIICKTLKKTQRGQSFME